MMSPRVRSLVRLLGLQLEVLGDDRPYWGEPRAPVRFAVTVNAARWRSLAVTSVCAWITARPSVLRRG